MKRAILLFLLIPKLVLCGEVLTKSKINSVEVFSDRAIIERVAKVDIPSGNNTLIFENLPPSILENSVKVSAKGSVPIEIMGIELERKDAENEELKELDKQIEEVEWEKKKVDTSLDLLKKEEELLMSIFYPKNSLNEKEGVSYKVDIFGLDKLFSFLTAKLEELNSKKLSLNIQSSELANKKKSLEKLRFELKQKSPVSVEICKVFVTNEIGGTFFVAVSYAVKGCSWQPSYILKALPEESKVEITTVASIIQKTFEDWNGASITLSTASPSMGIEPPQLRPTFVDLIEEVIVTGSPRTSKRKTEDLGLEVGVEGGVEGGIVGGVVAGVKTNLNEKSESEEYASEEKENFGNIATYSNAALENLGLTVRFSLSGRVNIPSDGKLHKFFLNKSKFDANFDYLVVPRKEEKGFMRAKFTNNLKFPILPGEVEFFYGGENMGSGELPYISIGDDIEAYFGKNNDILAKFEEVKRQKIEGLFLGNKEKIKFENKITVENLSGKEITLEILDKIPVSKNRQIEITDVSLAPEKQSLDENGITKWVFKLKVKEKKEIFISYTVAYPKGTKIKWINLK